jgi:hypothetical protein
LSGRESDPQDKREQGRTVTHGLVSSGAAKQQVTVISRDFSCLELPKQVERAGFKRQARPTE